MTIPLPFAPFAESARLAAIDAPGALAIVDGPVRLDRRTLDERAGTLADRLLAAGVVAGDRVALLARPSAGAIVVIHAVARIGAVIVPVRVGLTASEMRAAAAPIEPRIVIHGPGLGDTAEALGGQPFALEDLLLAGAGSPTRPAPTPRPDHRPAAAILTSGTTRHPKIVLLSGAALQASAEAWLSVLPPATSWLLAVGLAHVAGLGVVWRAGLAGVPLVVVDHPEPASILTALGTSPRPSHVSLIPATLDRILDASHDAQAPGTLRAVPLGGGPIPPGLVGRALRAGWPVVPTYGLSEAGSGVTALATVDAATHPESAGPPLPGVEIRIDTPDPTGVGEIEVLTPARFDGYLGDPTATAAVMAQDGWLRTGDLGRLDAGGRLVVLDRRTDRIVRGGENISPAEVEAVLREHPAVEDAAVVARRDDTFGQVPVAAIVLRARADPGDEALTAHCRSALAGFKIPVAFIRYERLPRTSGGKLQRAALRDAIERDATERRATERDAPRQQRHLDRPDGVRIVWRSVGSGPVRVVLLHGTLSTAAQMIGLARDLAASGELTVHSIDRRGSGASRLADPAPLDVQVHLDDLVAVLDAEEIDAPVFVGISYGGVVALEFAARIPDRVAAVIAYEPPYGPLAEPETQRALAAVADATEQAYDTGGPPAAAEAFMRGVAGNDIWQRLPDRTRAFLGDEGAGAYVDARLAGLDPDGLRHIRTPTTILTGDASETFYRPIADALVAWIPGARQTHLRGMGHASPITESGPIADAIRAALTGDPAGSRRP